MRACWKSMTNWNSMLCFVYKRLIQNSRFGDATAPQCFLQCPSAKSFSAISNAINEHSFTVSYLINSCGLSEEAALSTSKNINLKTPKKPDSVLSLLKNHGFSQTQISNLVRTCPRFLLADSEKTLKPKLEFFNSLGFSSPELRKIVSLEPALLARSLNNRIIPAVKFLRTILRTEKNLVAAIKHSARILAGDRPRYMARNMEVLRNHRVAESRILWLARTEPDVLVEMPERFNEIVKEVNEMGFNPLNFSFVLAVHVLVRVNKVLWKRKSEVLMRWGWSEDEILSAFRLTPIFMSASEKKMAEVMDFFVKRMGWESSVVAKYPLALMFSLEKRITPRCLVVQKLVSKGLIKKNFRLSSVIMPSERYFLDKFITRYKGQVPHLQNLYHGNGGSSMIAVESEEKSGL